MMKLYKRYSLPLSSYLAKNCSSTLASKTILSILSVSRVRSFKLVLPNSIFLPLPQLQLELNQPQHYLIL